MVRVNLLGVGVRDRGGPALDDRARPRARSSGSAAWPPIRGLPGSAGYSRDQGRALTALLEGLRPELRRLGVAVTTVHPGYVRTPMTAGQSQAPALPDGRRARRPDHPPGGRRAAARVDFPWRMAGLLGLVRLLPDAVYDPLAARCSLGPKDRGWHRSESSRAGDGGRRGARRRSASARRRSRRDADDGGGGGLGDLVRARVLVILRGAWRTGGGGRRTCRGRARAWPGRRRRRRSRRARSTGRARSRPGSASTGLRCIPRPPAPPARAADRPLESTHGSANPFRRDAAPIGPDRRASAQG